MVDNRNEPTRKRAWRVLVSELRALGAISPPGAAGVMLAKLAEAGVVPMDDEPLPLEIHGTWLVERTDRHTCGGGGPEASGMHEESCGLEPVVDLSTLPGLSELSDDTYRRRIDAANELLDSWDEVHHGRWMPGSTYQLLRALLAGTEKSDRPAPLPLRNGDFVEVRVGGLPGLGRVEQDEHGRLYVALPKEVIP